MGIYIVPRVGNRKNGRSIPTALKRRTYRKPSRHPRSRCTRSETDHGYRNQSCPFVKLPFASLSAYGGRGQTFPTSGTFRVFSVFRGKKSSKPWKTAITDRGYRITIRVDPVIPSKKIPMLGKSFAAIRGSLFFPDIFLTQF